MDNERWLGIKQLFNSTVDLTPLDRNAFLAEACLDDTELRQQVESLVESSLRSGAFLENPAKTDGRGVRGDLEGRRIGPYEVGNRIGAGGMGDVYRARDTRLNRSVAIKVRADRFAERCDLRERFAREAKAISALNHPRICLLHDVGHHDSIDFLVMEYVEGEPIDAYCDRRRLATRERLLMFRTVCEAVHYAHQNWTSPSLRATRSLTRSVTSRMAATRARPPQTGEISAQARTGHNPHASRWHRVTDIGSA